MNLIEDNTSGRSIPPTLPLAATLGHKCIKVIFGIALVVGLSFPADAASWFVRPSGGSGSGTSWTAAWNGLSGINWGSIHAGDTIYLAGGTYSGTLSYGTSGSSGSQININRATGGQSACTSAAGWSSSFDATVTLSGGVWSK